MQQPSTPTHLHATMYRVRGKTFFNPHPSSLTVSPLTQSDEVSALLLSELRQSSITVHGVRHAPGEVVGGETWGEGAKLRAKAEFDLAVRTYTERTEALEACAEGSRHE